MAEPPIIALEHISFAYVPQRPLFTDLNLAVHAGERLGLHAPNGSGKSTLFRLMVGLEKPAQGRVLFRGAAVAADRDWLKLRRNIGLVLQHAEDQLFCPTVLEDVAFGPLNLGLSQQAAREAAGRALSLLGLEGFAPRLTHKLSGGEKKLVALATVLAMDPEVLLLDEPCAGLDDTAQRRVVDVLRSLPAAQVIISHERGFLKRHTSRILTIAHGGLAESAG